MAAQHQIQNGNDQIDLDAEWERAWSKASVDFRATHGMDLSQGGWGTPDDVLNIIKREKKRDDDDLAKHEAARTVIHNTMAALEILLGIAGQATSMVFGGAATMCTNAISFLIDAGRNYKKIFTDLATLFHEVYAFLVRFTVYKRISRLDNKLKELIRESLKAFVRTCSISAYALKNHRTKMFFKSLIGDTTVVDELSNFRMLAEEESKLRGALSHEGIKLVQEETKLINVEIQRVNTMFSEMNVTVKETSLKIDGVSDQLTESTSSIKKAVASEGKKATEQLKLLTDKTDKEGQRAEQTRQRDNVKLKLGIDEKTGKDLYDENISKKLKNTGTWLTENGAYRDWADRESETDRILFLLADEDSGKTFTAYSAIQNLKTNHANDITSTFRVTIARYFFTHDTSSHSISRALKSLAWQICDNETVYLRRLASEEKRLDDNPGAQGLWDALFKQDPISDTIFFFVIDGFDHLEEEQQMDFAQMLAHINNEQVDKEHSTLNIRILVTATPKGHSIIKSKLKTPKPVIDMAEKSQGDVELFITDRVNSMRIFSDANNSALSKLKDEVIQGLLNLPKRNFTYLDFLLQSISKKSIGSQIHDLLERAKSWEGLEQSIGEEVKRCNASLSAYEKAELNEILLWVLSAKRPLRIQELEAVLHLTRDEDSLQRLADTITEKYGAFLTLKKDSEDDEDPHVALISEYVRKYFQDLAASQDRYDNNDEYAIQQSEVKMLRRFLSSVCDDDLYHRFGFDEFFSRKLNNSGVSKSEVQIVKKYLSTVCDNDLYYKFGFEEFLTKKVIDSSELGALNLENSDVHLARYCLKALCNSDEVAKQLHDYSGDHFQDHLKDADLNTSSLEDKAKIGEYLHQVFTDPETIARWWEMYKIFINATSWILEDEKSETVVEWFRDPAVIRKMSKPNQEWIRGFTVKSNLNMDLLRDITLWMAKTWLQDLDWDWDWRDYLYYGINGFINKIENRKNPDSVPRLKNLYIQHPRPDAIIRAVNWAKQELDIKEDYAYHVCIGDTHNFFEHWSSAIEEFNKAIALNPGMDVWQARYGLVQIFERMKDHEKVIENATDLLRDIKEGLSKPPENKAIADLLSQKLAGSYYATSQFDKAVELYRSLWETNKKDYAAMFGIATSLTKLGNYVHLAEFFDNLKIEKDEKLPIDRLSITYSETYQIDEHQKMAKSLSKEKAFDIVQQNCLHALEIVTKKEQEAKTMKDRDDWSSRIRDANAIYGSMLIDFGMSEATLLEGIKLLENVIGEQPLPSVETDFSFAKYHAALRLPEAYQRLINAHKEDSVGYESYVERFKKLAQEVKSKYSYDGPTMSLGRCYNQLGKTEDAKACLRGMMKVAFDYLADDDEENDWQGYYGLAECLIRVDDTKNFLAAWSLIGPTERRDVDSDTITSSTSEADELTGPITNRCDSCWKLIGYANDFWYCCDCPCVQFCRKCIDKHKTGELETVVCHIEHDFVHIPPWDAEKAKNVPKGHVRISEEETISIKVWEAQVKDQWGLS